MITIPLDLASQIKAARERLGLSQSEAALTWGVELDSLQNWEQGRSVPRKATLNRLLPILFPSEPSSKSTRAKK